MTLLTMSPAEFCTATRACAEGREFALRHATMAEVWDNCPRADWLLWIVDKLDQRPDDRTLRLFAVWCARNTPLDDGRVTGDLLTDPRSIAAIDISERYANGMATREEMAAAGAAAWRAQAAARDAAEAAAGAAAWGAAGAAAEATQAAAEAAAGATAWGAACAAGAAAEATQAAAGATAWATAWGAACAAGAAAEGAARAAQATQFRRMVPNPFRAKEAQL